ncbi:MAG: glycosyltransferase family 4 protein [Planctomycetota bacterium]|nr:glycosyltransferase family 4 protein [Planctomycetota bacterium]
MLVYAALPLYKNYADRYRMFMSMCDHGARVRMLLLHGEHPRLESPPPGFEQLSIREGTSFFTRRADLRKLIVPAPKAERTVVHDTGLLQMGQVLRHRGPFAPTHRTVRNVLALYSPTISFLLQGHWLRAEGRAVNLSELKYYLRKHVPHVLAELLFCHLADGVTGNTQEIVDDLGHYYGVPRPRTRFIPAEVDTRFFTPGPVRRGPLNLPPEPKLVLFVGNYQRRKGVDILLRAFDQASLQLPDARLILLGGFADTGRNWVQPLVDSLACAPRVEFRPAVDQETLRDYYRSVDLLVCSSRHEGSPRVIKEAMACGTPVVSTRIPGALAIDPHARAIEFVPVDRPEEMARAIQGLLTVPSRHQARSQAGLQLTRETLSPLAIARRYLDFYDDIFRFEGPS